MSNRMPYLIKTDGSEYLLKNTMTIGAASNDDILLQDASVQPEHASLIINRERVMVRPKTGTILIDGKKVNGLTEVKEGQTLMVGKIGLKLLLKGNQMSPPAQATSPPTIWKATKGNTSFGQFDDIMMDEPSPPSPVSQPVTSSTTPLNQQFTTPPLPSSGPVNNAIVNAHISSKPLGKRNQILAPSQPSSSPTISGKLSSPATKFTPEERKEILRKFFHGAQIFREKNGMLEYNLANRWRRTNSLVGITFVLATEAMKAVARAILNRTPKPLDAQLVDKAIEETIFDLVDVAKSELNIFDHQLIRDPLIIYGPIFWRASGIPIENTCAREAHDGLMRFSAHKVSVLLLTDNKIGVYTCNLDTLDGVRGSQADDTYLYSDITAVSAKDTQMRLDMGKETKDIVVHAFRLIVPGDDVTITLSSPAIREQFGADAAVQPEYRKTINVIREVWQSKKTNLSP